jgi:hypothetical protein
VAINNFASRFHLFKDKKLNKFLKIKNSVNIHANIKKYTLATVDVFNDYSIATI